MSDPRSSDACPHNRYVAGVCDECGDVIGLASADAKDLPRCTGCHNPTGTSLNGRPLCINCHVGDVDELRSRACPGPTKRSEAWPDEPCDQCGVYGIHHPRSETARGSVLDEVASELARARAKFARFNSAHEGFAVLDEERDELWDEVKANHPDRKARMRAEAIQVAAMAIRFIEDVCDAT